MKYSLEKTDKYTLLTIDEGKLDSIVAPDLKSELVKLNTNGERNIILDLGQVSYIDSSGLSSILVGNRLCSNADGKLILCRVNEHVDKLLSISQLKDVLEILPTSAEAVDHVHLDELERNLKSDQEAGE